MPGPARTSQRQPNRGLGAHVRKVLPPAGRCGAPPAWPLAGRAPKIWAELWAMPQAVAWEELHLERVVARYAAKLLESEKPLASSSICAEVRQMEDRLGLSAMAMLRLGWAIAEKAEVVGTEATVTSIDRYQAMVNAG